MPPLITPSTLRITMCSLPSQLEEDVRFSATFLCSVLSCSIASLDRDLLRVGRSTLWLRFFSKKNEGNKSFVPLSDTPVYSMEGATKKFEVRGGGKNNSAPDLFSFCRLGLLCLREEEGLH